MDWFSSMRAATRVGMVFVGRVEHAPVEENSFTLRVIPSDPLVMRERAAFQEALSRKVNQIRMQAETAVEESERLFWLTELDRILNLQS